MAAKHKNASEALNLSMLAGEIMLRNGGETYRVEDTMKRILNNCGYASAESFVTTTGVFACITDGEAGTVTMVRRVKNRANNFEKVSQVNDLSRTFAEGKLTVQEAMAKLESIAVLPLNSPFIRIFASGVACFCFCYIYGGEIPDCINAFFTGFILQVFVIPMYKSNVTSVLIHILGGAIISFISLTLMNLGIGNNIDKVIIGSLMPLLPGVALTNAIRDILEGDYLSGTTRIVDAAIIAIAIAAGVGTVLKLWIDRFGGISI